VVLKQVVSAMLAHRVLTEARVCSVLRENTRSALATHRVRIALQINTPRQWVLWQMYAKRVLSIHNRQLGVVCRRVVSAMLGHKALTPARARCVLPGHTRLAAATHCVRIVWQISIPQRWAQ